MAGAATRPRRSIRRRGPVPATALTVTRDRATNIGLVGVGATPPAAAVAPRKDVLLHMGRLTPTALRGVRARPAERRPLEREPERRSTREVSSRER